MVPLLLVVFHYALAGTALVVRNVTVTEPADKTNESIEYDGGHEPPVAEAPVIEAPVKCKRQETSGAETREWENKIKHIAGSGIDYGVARHWKARPWIKADEYSEDWFALDYELCRNSIPLTDVEGCIVFRGLEWLLFSMTHTASQITSTDLDVLYAHSTEQRGPFALSIRAILIWTDILRDAKAQLEATKVLNVQAQLKLVPCYLDYAYQVTAFLQALEAQGGDFKEEDPLRCLMFDKMEILYMSYIAVANLMHGNDPAIRTLFEARFPDILPSYWHSKYEQPKPGELISDYVRRNDWPMLGEDSPFRRAQIAWRCVDDRAQFAATYPSKWGEWEDAGRPSKKDWLDDKKAQKRKDSKALKKHLKKLDQ